MVAGAILAAGEGSRFGGRKQLARLAGRPLLEHAVLAMTAAPGIERTVVVLGAEADDVRARVDLHGAEAVVCRDWREGMAASLRCAVDALDEADAVVVALGDQPWISPEAIAEVVAGLKGDELAVRATYQGVPGHPVALKRPLFDRVRALRGDVGARDLLARVPVRERECGHLGRADDVDTLAQLDALQPDRE